MSKSKKTTINHIRLSTNYAGPLGCYDEGTILTCTNDQCKEFTDSFHAVEVEIKDAPKDKLPKGVDRALCAVGLDGNYYGFVRKSGNIIPRNGLQEQTQPEVE